MAPPPADARVACVLTRQPAPAGAGGAGGGPGGPEAAAAEAAKREEQEEQRRLMLVSVLDPSARERRALQRRRPPAPPPSRAAARARSPTGRLTRCCGSGRCAVSRIAIVKPDKARAIENQLIQMAQKGMIRQKIDEKQLIGMLEGIDKKADSGRTKITFKRRGMDSDEDDVDDDDF